MGVPHVSGSEAMRAHVSEEQEVLLDKVSTGFPRRAAAYLALLLLTLTFIVDQWDRYLLPYVSKEVIRELDLSDTEYGLLTGYAFTLPNMCAGLLLGRTADRANRKWLVAVSLALFTVCTASTSWTHSFPSIFGARLGLGISEAAIGPATYSMIGDLFPPHLRASACGVYNFGIYVGGALASASQVIDTHLGWRVTFRLVALLGAVIFILLIIFLREPVREGEEDRSTVAHADAPPLSKVAWTLVRNKRFLLCSLGIAFRFWSGFAMASFATPFTQRVLHVDGATFGLWNAGIVLIFGGGASVIGGRLADKNLADPLRVPLYGTLLSLPTVTATFLAPNLASFLGLLSVTLILGEVYVGPSVAFLQSEVTPRERGLATSVGLFVASGVGIASTEIAGALLDRYTPLVNHEYQNVHRTRYILLSVYLFGYCAAALCYGSARWLGRRRRTLGHGQEYREIVPVAGGNERDE